MPAGVLRKKTQGQQEQHRVRGTVCTHALKVAGGAGELPAGVLQSDTAPAGAEQGKRDCLYTGCQRLVGGAGELPAGILQNETAPAGVAQGKRDCLYTQVQTLLGAQTNCPQASCRTTQRQQGWCRVGGTVCTHRFKCCWGRRGTAGRHLAGAMVSSGVCGTRFRQLSTHT